MKSVLRVVVLGALLWMGLPAGAVGGVDPVEAESSNAKLRSQLHSFAPYISMYNNRLTLGQSDVGTVLGELTRLKEFQDNTFDASEALKYSFRDIRGFLVRSEKRITPATPKDSHVSVPLVTPTSVELVFAVALLRQFEEIARNEDLRNWQNEYDVKCRDAYRKLMPGLRSVATGVKGPADSIAIVSSFDETNWVYLAAVNRSHRTLHNVTLAVRLTTIDGSASDHYYFIPEWSEERNKYPLRLASDWFWGNGASMTTRATVDLISDEVVCSGISCPLEENVPIAADAILAKVDDQIHHRKQLKGAIDKLESMKDLVAKYPDRAARRAELLTSAREKLAAILKDFDERIKKEEQYIASRRDEAAGAKTLRSDPARAKKEIEVSDKEMKRLKVERQDFVNGKR